ncbi:beta-Ala-His dipeptidase [Lagierella sp.]|uniref:beta-Ala-His dipeptidase n=1 Tax=Lagierella sp. TaxID=2849657 RepID=UPI0026094CE1|nr:beta-Ala-His dipeptidase [Lagierella sp.]
MSADKVFEFFEEISRIPRCSYNEEKIASYLLAFAREKGLKAIKDEYNNVTIIREASEGYEDKPGIILQGHIDMVCEKVKGSKHDFSKDPIELIYDGNYLRANGTTLGADNGIAIAMGLSILSKEDLKAPRIEFVATATEETGLVGATNYPTDLLKGKYFINIDSEEEGILIAGCAGGMDIDLKYEIDRKPVEGNVYSLLVHNLKGGHSGMSIHEKLLNAIKSGGQILDTIRKENEIKIIKISGGTKHNAIPREFEVDFVSKEELGPEIYMEDYRQLKEIEDNIEIDLTQVGYKKVEAFTEDLTNRLIDAITKIPHGVKSYMEGEYSDIVESSLNLAIVDTKENTVDFKISARSSKNDKKEKISDEIHTIANETKGEFIQSSSYKAWEFKEESPLRDIAVKSYKEYTGENLEVSVIHAGLECAIFAEKYPNIDTISIGPNILKVHTPEEKLDIESTKRTYDFVEFLINKLS